MSNNRRSNSLGAALTHKSETAGEYYPPHTKGYYIDGPHRKNLHEFYATAPAYSEPYKNPWTARIVRNSRPSKKETELKPLKASIIDKVMAVAVLHRFSPSKQETQLLSSSIGAGPNTWHKWLAHVFTVGTGTLVGLGLRPVDKIRDYTSRLKKYFSRAMGNRDDGTYALTILVVGVIGSFSLVGLYVVTGSDFTPVEPINVQSEPTRWQPLGQSEAEGSDESDNTTAGNTEPSS